MTEYITKDSGKRQEFSSGMRRDTNEGKADYTLVDRPMLRRWAELLQRGAEKYGRDNWRLADSPEELLRFQASAFRHFMQWVNGDVDEDHASAVYFNIAAAEMVKTKLVTNEPVKSHEEKYGHPFNLCGHDHDYAYGGEHCDPCGRPE